MPTNTPGNTARQSAQQQTHYIRATVNWNDPGIATGRRIGTLPAGAIITRITARVVTAFNAATTNVLTVGTNATAYNNLVASGNVTNTANTTSTPTTGVGAIMPADTDVFATFTQTGAAATAGQVVYVIEYAANNDL